MSRREDLAGREAAQTLFAGTLVLEAGAGTGKTTTLVARILAWTLGRGWEEEEARLGAGGVDADSSRIAAAVLDGVVAITFTEAAAAEMARKVAEALAAVATDRKAPVGFDPALLPAAARERRSERSRALLGALERLTVETIHAFCRRLLARHPLEAGIHPQVQVDADQRLTEAIASEVVEEAVRRAYAVDPTHRLVRLAAFGHGPAELREALTGLVNDGVPLAVLAPDPFARAGCMRLFGELCDGIEAFLSAGGQALDGAGGKSAETVRALQRLRDAAVEADAAETAGAEAVETWLRPLQDAFDDTLWERLKKWSGGDFNKSETRAVGEAAGASAAAASALRDVVRNLRHLRPVALDTARRALAPLLSEVHRRADARGTLAFASLLREAHDLLAGNERLRARERRRIRQLLVDEFQDTDPLQCDLVRWLALEGDEAERPGLFLVGDPKQSIFGWRSADLAAYHGFVRRALAAGGQRFRLVRNFRSLPEVLAEVSRLVGPLMSHQEGYQPEFQELVAALPEEKARGPAAIEYWVSWERGGDGAFRTKAGARGEGVHRLEAAAVAAALRAAHEGGARWSELAVLFRYRTAFDAYLEVLRDAGVPFVVARDRQYYHRREVIEATALVHAVVDPSDHLSALAYLRSAWAGLPDAALLPLWARGMPRWLSELDGPDDEALSRLEAMVAEVADELPPSVPGLDRIAGWEIAVREALRALAELRAAYRRLPADRFVRFLRRRTLMDVTEGSRYQGRYRLANLDLLFRRLERAAEEQEHDLSAILRTLRRSLEETPDAPEAQPKDAGEDAVQVMTVHTAKGLEFRQVFLVETHHEPQQSDEERWDPALPGEYRLFGRPTPHYHHLAARRRRIRALEEVRTLYVALTRPIERLVVVGHWSETKEPRPVERARSLLHLVESHPAAPASLLDWAREADTAGTDRLERDGAVWRFLALDPGLGEGTRAAPRQAPATDVAAARASARRLAARRDAAARRMALPFGRAASADAGARLAALAATAPGEEERSGEAASTRDAALLAGSAVHRLLQGWDHGADAEEEWTRGREALQLWLGAVAPPATLAAAIERSEALLARLAEGVLFRRFLALGPRILARELPVLLPPDEGAAAYVAGAVDLVYRDEDGGLVVADYKTDRLEGDSELAERAALYAPQEALYARALQEALALPHAPRTELWFLWPDRLWPEG